MKAFIKKIPGVLFVKRIIFKVFNINQFKGKSKIDLLESFPLYNAMSSGNYKNKSLLTIQAINYLPYSLEKFIESIGYKNIKYEIIESFFDDKDQLNNSKKLKKSLDYYKSDKAIDHNYHILYSNLFKNSNDVLNIFEIGLGTNNSKIVSTMGANGQPGASLKAFKNYFQNASIIGADIDSKILFSEDRIKTYYIDQTNPDSFIELNRILKDKSFDLMIDDGLHSPFANLNSLHFFLPKLNINGWVVIEDIREEALPFWNSISRILPKNYDPFIFQAKNAFVFAIKKTE